MLKCSLILIIYLFSVKPSIDHTNLKNIVVSCGKTVIYDISIKGKPAPLVKWQLVDKEVCLIIFYFCLFLSNSKYL